jgi:hypothetical protein
VLFVLLARLRLSRYEYPAMVESGSLGKMWGEHFATFVGVCLLGFTVNVSGFCVIQTTGAVTLKVLGTARNAGLILFCWMFLGEVITATEGMGYLAALTAFIYYTYLQVGRPHEATPPPPHTHTHIHTHPFFPRTGFTVC